MSVQTDHTPQPHYLAQLEAMHQRGAFEPGEVYHVVIEHDDWCQIFAGKACNCHPDITPERA